MRRQSVTLKGEEKEQYFKEIDSALETLATNLAIELSPSELQSFKDFGIEKGFDLTRLVSLEKTNETLSHLVNDVREQYSWFRTIIDQEDSSNNRAWFDQVDLSTSTGLPFYSELIKLHHLKRDTFKHLRELQDYDSLQREFVEIMTGDYTSEEKNKKSEDVLKKALKRGFIEKLDNENLLGWEAKTYKVDAKNVLSLPLEDLYSITAVNNSLVNGIYQIYIFDIWQDKDISDDQKHIYEGEHGTEVSHALKSELRIAEGNQIWLAIRSIDRKFEYLHPVHVSRMLIGPFDTKYRKYTDDHPKLNIADDIQKTDSEAGFFRASLQYSYAPNVEETVENKLRQKIYAEDWRDEFIVCKGKYSDVVSKSVEGERVKVFEM